MKYFIVIFFTICILSGCTKQSNPVTNFIYTHSDSDLVGTMTGYVALYDSLYSSFVNGISIVNRSGVKISLDGTPFSTTSDSSGRWTLEHIPAGTYTVSYSKAGFATEKNISYKFIGNGIDYLGKEYLFEIPTLHPTLVLRPFEDGKEVTYKDTTYIYDGDTMTYRKQDSIFVPNGIATFTGNVALKNADEAVSISLFIARTPHIDPLDPNSYVITQTGTAYYLYRDSLYKAGFKPGDQIYCMTAVQTLQCYYYATYYDIASGKNIYTGFCPYHSEVKSFILP